MPDETINVEVKTNLPQVTSEAKEAKGAIDGIRDSVRRMYEEQKARWAEMGNNIPINQGAPQRATQDAIDSAARIRNSYGALATPLDDLRKEFDKIGDSASRLNLYVQRGDDDLKMIARSFTGVVSSGRALSELGRAGSIFGQLIGDEDLKRTGQMTVALGELVMVAGRLPQLSQTLGLSMAGLGVAGLGIGAVAALSAAQSKTPLQTVSSAWTPFTQSGTESGLALRQQLESMGVKLPNLGQALDNAANGANKLADAATSAADKQSNYFDALTKGTDAIDKMNEAQLKNSIAEYAGGNKIANQFLGFLGVNSPFSYLQEAAQKRLGVVQAQNTPAGQLRQAISEGNVGTVDKMFPTNAMDLTKYTQQEITQAKQMSVAATNSELQALRQQAQALGLTKDEVDAVVALRQKEIDAMVQLITLQGQSSYLTGAEANHLQQMLSAVKTNEQQEKSSFNFQRLSNVSSGQFPQLAALASMYNAMLTKLGSPEKSETQNLLLSDGTFKTMNVRMTALQLALEDLTKVEKAQLSGTWNLPAGATALVPISSLDLQRWNKSGSGMPDLSALLGATTRSGDTVASSQQLAATRIIDAIHSTFSRMGLPTAEVDKAKTVAEAVTAARGTLRGEDKQTVGEFYDKWAKGDNPMVYKFTDYMTGLFLNSQRDYVHQRSQQQPITSQLLRGTTNTANVTVSALPIKANLTAQVNVLMNGAVVARALMPLMFDMLTKLTAATGYRQQGVTR